jgi:fructose-1,6-bisphosphatase I
MTHTSWTPPDASKAGATLETFILEGMFQVPGATGTFTSLLNQVCLAAKLITGRVRRAGLADVLGWTGDTNVQGESVQKLDVIANETMIGVLRRRGHCRGVASEENEQAVFFPHARGGYLVVVDPLDGSSNIDVDISIGTIFGILRTDKNANVTDESFLVPGTSYAAAGYVIYGSSTVLVLSTGKGVHGFTTSARWWPTRIARCSKVASSPTRPTPRAPKASSDCFTKPIPWPSSSRPRAERLRRANNVCSTSFRKHYTRASR